MRQHACSGMICDSGWDWSSLHRLLVNSLVQAEGIMSSLSVRALHGFLQLVLWGERSLLCPMITNFGWLAGRRICGLQAQPRFWVFMQHGMLFVNFHPEIGHVGYSAKWLVSARLCQLISYSRIVRLKCYLLWALVLHLRPLVVLLRLIVAILLIRTFSPFFGKLI